MAPRMLGLQQNLRAELRVEQERGTEKSPHYEQKDNYLPKGL